MHCHLRNRRTAYLFTDSPKLLVDACCPISRSSSTSFHFSQQTVAPHVQPPALVLAFASHLCPNDTVLRSHRMNESGSPDSQSVNFDIAPVVKLRYQCRYHVASFKCPCISQFKQCCDCGCEHVTGSRGSSMRETQGTNVADAGCPAGQHTR